MAFGGGTWIAQNKVLPGSYINFVSAAAASATLSDRGVVGMGLELNWGADNEIIIITNADFQKNSKTIFGYSYDADELKGLRDLFLNTTTLYAYRLNSGGAKATNTYATALCSGTRGNDLKIVIQVNVDDENLFDVSTLLDNVVVDTQTVSGASGLVSNDYVSFKATATLAVNAGLSLSGGTNATVTGESHQKFLDNIERCSVNAIGYVGTDNTIKALYAAFTKRMRDEAGKKFQCVVYNYAADHEGVVNLKNNATDSGVNAASLVYWVTGVIAGTAVNRSASNKVYNGEFTPNLNYTQAQLEASITAGEFTLHQVDTDARVLTDINSLVTVSDEKGDIFKSNQTIRVIDQIGNDIAVLFNTKYLGTVPNDNAGRTSLWLDIVKHHEALEAIRAIEDFDAADVTVERGDTKKSVLVTDAVTVVNAMEQLYMTCVIS